MFACYIQAHHLLLLKQEKDTKLLCYFFNSHDMASVHQFRSNREVGRSCFYNTPADSLTRLPTVIQTTGRQQTDSISAFGAAVMLSTALRQLPNCLACVSLRAEPTNHQLVWWLGSTAAGSRSCNVWGLNVILYNILPLLRLQQCNQNIMSRRRMT